MAAMTSHTELPIYGFSIHNFRSFGPDLQYIGPFKKMNIIIGENNSGKSNVIRYISNIIHPTINGNPTHVIIKDIDIPKDEQQACTFVVFSIPINETTIKNIYDDTNEAHHNDIHGEYEPLKQMFSTPFFNSNDKYCSIPISLKTLKITDFENYPLREMLDKTEQRTITNAWIRSTGQRDGTIHRHHIPELYERFLFRNSLKCDIKLIHPFRKIQSRLEEYKDELHGNNISDDTIIDELAAWQRPDLEKMVDRVKFDKIQDFLRSVLKKKDVEVLIPDSKNTIQIRMDSRILPIEALGTGIHELVIIAVQAVILDNSVICIEEPELHFHPELQRQLMSFLYKETSNQYFFTTHSAHIMDAVPCSVTSVYMKNGYSKTVTPFSNQDKRMVLHDMGYRSSDLLQANCIIWVEGPSDRIYLNNWIRLAAEDLEEGWHYSIMFYGGRLLSHLKAEDSEVDGFISLLSINRFSAIVIDSDRDAKGKNLNATKLRVIKEFEEIGSFFWVTDGREIENYIPDNDRLKAIQCAHKKAIDLAYRDNKYAKPLNYKIKNGEEKTKYFNKVKIALEAMKISSNLDILDLRKQVQGICKFIRKANGMDT